MQCLRPEPRALCLIQGVQRQNVPCLSVSNTRALLKLHLRAYRGLYILLCSKSPFSLVFRSLSNASVEFTFFIPIIDVMRTPPFLSLSYKKWQVCTSISLSLSTSSPAKWDAWEGAAPWPTAVLLALFFFY